MWTLIYRGKNISCLNKSFETLEYFLLVVCQKREVFYLAVLVQDPARLQWQDHYRPQPHTCVHPFSAGAPFQNHLERWWKTCAAKHRYGTVSRKQNSNVMASNVQIQSTEQREHQFMTLVQILYSKEKSVNLWMQCSLPGGMLIISDRCVNLICFWTVLLAIRANAGNAHICAAISQDL